MTGLQDFSLYSMCGSSILWILVLPRHGCYGQMNKGLKLVLTTCWLPALGSLNISKVQFTQQ